VNGAQSHHHVTFIDVDKSMEGAAAEAKDLTNPVANDFSFQHHAPESLLVPAMAS